MPFNLIYKFRNVPLYLKVMKKNPIIQNFKNYVK